MSVVIFLWIIKCVYAIEIGGVVAFLRKGKDNGFEQNQRLLCYLSLSHLFFRFERKGWVLTPEPYLPFVAPRY